jgi:hypothetical protein
LLRSRNKSRFAVGFWEYFGAAVFSTFFEKHSPHASGACGSHVERTLIRAFRRATLVHNGYRLSIVHPLGLTNARHLSSLAAIGIVGKKRFDDFLIFG